VFAVGWSFCRPAERSDVLLEEIARTELAGVERIDTS